MMQPVDQTRQGNEALVLDTDQIELAELLCEVCPSFGGSTLEIGIDINDDKELLPSPKRSVSEVKTLKQKVEVASTILAGSPDLNVDWSNLQELHPLDSLRGDNLPEYFDVNSGGEIFLCFFIETRNPAKNKSDSKNFEVGLIKFAEDRLNTQAELLASELAQYLRIPTPRSRIVRKSHAQEWLEISNRLQSLENESSARMESLMLMHSCFLLMEYIHTTQKNVEISTTEAFFDMGKLLVLDMILGNPDRLPCRELRWRGNIGNVLFGSVLSRYQGRLVAIDSCFPRQPPSFQIANEKEATTKIAELIINDETYSNIILHDIFSQWNLKTTIQWTDCVKQFQRGVLRAMNDLLEIKGLFEMMHNVLTEWTQDFIADLEKESPSYKARLEGRTFSSLIDSTQYNVSPDASTDCPVKSVLARKRTPEKIRLIIKRSAENTIVHEKLAYWKNILAAKGEYLMQSCFLTDNLTGLELKEGILNWHRRRGSESSMTTGFLDAANPVVDVYELKLRVTHVLKRLRFLQDARATERPSQILPNLFIGSALSSQGLHLLRYLDITHIVNVTQDVELPPEEAGFKSLRIPVTDSASDNIALHFQIVLNFLKQAEMKKGRVLIHCQEGRSRSCTLAIAYLITSLGMSVEDALVVTLNIIRNELKDVC